MFGMTEMEKHIQNLKICTTKLKFVCDFAKPVLPDANTNIVEFMKHQSYENVVNVDGFCWLITGNVYSVENNERKQLHSAQDVLNTAIDNLSIEIWAQGMIAESFVQIHLGKRKVASEKVISAQKIAFGLN